MSVATFRQSRDVSSTFACVSVSTQRRGVRLRSTASRHGHGTDYSAVLGYLADLLDTGSPVSMCAHMHVPLVPPEVPTVYEFGAGADSGTLSTTVRCLLRSIAASNPKLRTRPAALHCGTWLVGCLSNLPYLAWHPEWATTAHLSPGRCCPCLTQARFLRKVSARTCVVNAHEACVHRGGEGPSAGVGIGRGREEGGARARVGVLARPPVWCVSVGACVAGVTAAVAEYQAHRMPSHPSQTARRPQSNARRSKSHPRARAQSPRRRLRIQARLCACLHGLRGCERARDVWLWMFGA